MQNKSLVRVSCHKYIGTLVAPALLLFALLISSTAKAEQWLPWATRVCEGQTYTAINAAGQTRTQTGVKSQYCRCTAGFAPKRESVCVGKTFTASCKNSAWSHYEQIDYGNKRGSTWAPNRNTVFQGTSFTQTSECGVTRTVTGTKVPLDSDNDGVADHLDSCASTPAGKSVNAQGCALVQLDSDRDGINDERDACPGTPNNQRHNDDGCTFVQLKDDACPNPWQGTDALIKLAGLQDVPWANAADKRRAKSHLARTTVVETIDNKARQLTSEDLVGDPLTVASECLVYRNHVASGREYAPPAGPVERRLSNGWIPATY